MSTRKNKIILVLFITTLLGSAGMPVFAASDANMTLGDIKAGNKLHQKYCMKCHNNSVYTRKIKKVHSYEGLVGRVKACSQQTGVSFSRKQLQDVTAFLNHHYYEFQN